MKFWDDSLRICPKCRGKVSMPGEGTAQCPHCGDAVAFFHFREILPPPDLPSPPSLSFWGRPTTSVLLVAIGLFGLVAVFGFFNRGVVVVSSALAAIGFSAFAFLRHKEAHDIESSVTYLEWMGQYAAMQRDRVRETVERYNALLYTGDARIQRYFDTIYREAEGEKVEAQKLRAAAGQDRAAVKSVEARIYAMAERFIRDHLRWVERKLRADPESYQRNKLELTKAFDFVEAVGYSLPSNVRNDALDDLKRDYQEKVKVQTLKDEQQRIKKQMREEEQIRREREEAVRETDRQEREIQQRLSQALRTQRDIHSAEVELLRQELADAQARAQRAKSLAQQTKIGHVYILSNIGSFGDKVFKIGMTRRQDPHDRVKELSDASVPFPFDVHAMILCDDAPALENLLHRELTRYRVNRINLRKEYFSVELSKILAAVERNHGLVQYVAEPEALEFRESNEVTPESLVDTARELEEAGVHFEEADE